MGIRTAASSFYHNHILPTWQKVKGLYKGKSVTDTTSNTTPIVAPHQRTEDVHRDAPIERRVRLQPNVTPRLTTVTPVIGTQTDSEQARLQLITPKGDARQITGVPLNAPFAALRVRLAEELGVPPSLLMNIKVNGRDVTDDQPVWTLADNDNPATVRLEFSDQEQVPLNLEQDIHSLFEDPLPLDFFDDRESVFDQLNTYAYKFCQDVMNGEMTPDDKDFTDLKDCIDEAISYGESAPVNDKHYALAYLRQLSNMLNGFQTYHWDEYQPPDISSEPLPDLSLQPGQSIHINADKLRKALGNGRDEEDALSSSNMAEDSATIPLLAGVAPVQPGSNLGFMPLPRPAFGGMGSESVITPAEPVPVPDTRNKTATAASPLNSVINQTRQHRLNEELAELFDPEWTDGWSGIDWKKATELVRAGADPSVATDVDNCPNPLFLAAANYTGDPVLRRDGYPHEFERLECLREMLKHPNALKAMKETDDDDYGNTPLTHALAVGDQAAAQMMVDYLDQAMVSDDSAARLLVEPNQKKGATLAQNTPLMLALKTGCDEVAKKLAQYYGEDDLLNYESLSGYDVLDMICYTRREDLMPLVELYAPDERRPGLSALYLAADPVPPLEEEVYSRDMYLGDRGNSSSELVSRPPVSSDTRFVMEQWQNPDNYNNSTF